MECSVCRIRGPVGFCAICRQLLCEECGVECVACGRLVCATHRCGERRGEHYCQECAPKTPVRDQTPAPVPPPPAPNAPEVLSFDQLTAEMGAAAFHLSEPVETPEKASLPAETSSPPGGKVLRRMPSNDPNEFRILTASSPKGTPIWLSGLFTGGMACILLLPLFKQSGFVDFQPWYSYAVMLMAFSAVLWSGYGLSRREDKPTHRGLCLIGFLLGLLAALLAFGMRNPDIQL